MSRVTALFLGVFLAVPVLGASPDPKDLVIPPAEVARARDLIRRLGSDVYREREEAQAELAKMGRLARPALLEAVSTDPDPEIRFRCSRLLPKAGAEDLKARLETFLADTEGKFEHDLPGFKPFRKSVGADKLARELYVEIIKSPYNVDLLQAMDKSVTEGGRGIADRRMLLWNNLQQRNFNGRIQPSQPISLADIACLLFAESQVPSKEIPRNNMWNYVTGTTFIQQPASMSIINNGGSPHAEAYKRIISLWMESREDVFDLNQLAYPVGQLLTSFKECIPLLRKIINTEGVAGYAKGQALTSLVRLRGKEEQSYVRGLLANDTLVTSVWFGGGPGQVVQHQCLLKDVALAILINQSGLKLTDFGFIFPNGMQPVGLQNIGYGNYAFPSEEARSAAMVKFGFYRMKQAFKEPESGPEPKK